MSNMVTIWTHSEAKYVFRLYKKYCITLRSEGQRLLHRTHKPGVGGSYPLLTTINYETKI